MTDHKMTEREALIKQLSALLRGGQAHAGFDKAVADFPAALRGVVPDKLPYSAWQILAHMRFTQRDILDFSAPPTGGYHAHQWPADYWLKDPVPPTSAAWDAAIAEILSDRAKFEALLGKPGADLNRPFLWGEGQTLLREALLIADHNAYHLGELVPAAPPAGLLAGNIGVRIMNEPEVLRAMLAAKTIAVIGISDDNAKPSHYVSAAMQARGHRILPVNPALSSVLGEAAYASLTDLPVKPDLVNVFRLPRFLPAIVDEMIALGLHALWTQLGIIHPEAAAKAEAHGIARGHGSLPDGGEPTLNRARNRTPNPYNWKVNLFARRAVLVCLFALFGVAARAQIAEVGDGSPGPVKAQHLTAELTALAPGISPGGTDTIGLVITLEEHWHVYWVNAGDSGSPPNLKWTLPAGLSAGTMQFPAPTRLPLGPLMDFGYEDEVAFPITLTAAPSTKPGPVHLEAHVNWLVCSTSTCVPGKAHLGLNLNVAPGSPAGQPVGAIGQALGQLPRPLPANMQFSVTGGAKDFVLTLITGTPEEDAEFYPFDQDLIANSVDQVVEKLPNGLRLRVQRAPELTKLPDTLHGIIKLSEHEVYDVTAPVLSGEVAATGKAASPQDSKVTALGAIGLALLGGVILNLMPCVFPVLFLKGLALVQSSGEERKRMRGHGLVYTLGILVSFWIIVAILLTLRAGGSQAGWGFQLQSPVFIAVLASFLFFFALSLAGQFDLGLSLTSAGGELAARKAMPAASSPACSPPSSPRPALRP